MPTAHERAVEILHALGLSGKEALAKITDIIKTDRAEVRILLLEGARRQRDAVTDLIASIESTPPDEIA